MIVNPQTFNYRLIIGTLIIAMLGLGAYSFSSYNTLKNQKEFLVQEKKIVENELSKIILRYDELISQNEEISAQLDSAKQRTLKILDTLKFQKASIFIISKYRKEMVVLQDERNKFLALANSLKKENKLLHQEKVGVARKLKEQTDVSQQLSERNTLLAENLKKGSKITANSFLAKALITRSNGKEIETTKAKRTDVMEVCFTLAENYLASSGTKDLFVQIISPDGNIIGDKMTKEFGNYTLVYSTKLRVNYDNEVVDICVKAEAGQKEKEFSRGTYYVNVFHNQKKLGSTEIVLN